MLKVSAPLKSYAVEIKFIILENSSIDEIENVLSNKFYFYDENIGAKETYDSCGAVRFFRIRHLENMTKEIIILYKS